MKIRAKTLAKLKEDESCDAEFYAMLQHVCRNAEFYGIADEWPAIILAHILILEKRGLVYRTGKKYLTKRGLWQDVYSARKPR
jgi:hypothetical protein